MCEAGLHLHWSAGLGWGRFIAQPALFLWISLLILCVAVEWGMQNVRKTGNSLYMYSLSVCCHTHTLIIGGMCGRKDCKEREREREFPTFDAWPSCSDKILKQFFDSQLSHRFSDILLQDKSHTHYTHIQTPNCYNSPRPFPLITLPLSNSYTLSSSTYYPYCSLFFHLHTFLTIY